MTCNYDASDFLELGLLYHGWDRERIGRNSEQTTTTSMPKKQTPWEIAKPILEKEYLAGRITDQMKPGHVHKLREEFTAVPINNFRNNFNKMKDVYRQYKARANIEERALRHDMELYPPAPNRWHGSKVQALLKEDIENGEHLKFENPTDFRNSREEYGELDKKEFRDRVWQVVRGGLESNYWLVKRDKKKQHEEDEPTEEDIQFFLDSEYS